MSTGGCEDFMSSWASSSLCPASGIMHDIDTVIRLNNQIERCDSIRSPRHLATAPADDAR